MPPPIATKILFVGDMHLGRSASRIPTSFERLGGPCTADLTPVAAWQRLVAAALDDEVAVVALAGDLVHRGNDVFEARAHLEKGIARLTAAGIKVVAVAGNHDTKVLPALAEIIDDLHLLGPGGTWSTFAVNERVRLVGWSFPDRHHTQSPLRTPPPAATSGLITIGLLHADLDAAQSQYAPVSSAGLAATGYQGWALGHIHTPGQLPGPDDQARPFYLGSINGCLPTETGAHGPVLATISPDGKIRWRRIVLAPLRWQHPNFAADTLETAPNDRELQENLNNFLLRKINEMERPVPGSERALGLRVTLSGTHPQANTIRRLVSGLDYDQLVTIQDDCAVFVEKISCDLTVRLDLAALRQRTDLPGLLARQIHELQNGRADELLEQARARIGEIPGHQFPGDPAPDEAALRTLLTRSARHALSVLLGQAGEGAS